MKKTLNRRDFIQFLGQSGLVATSYSNGGLLISAYKSVHQKNNSKTSTHKSINTIAPSSKDEFKIPDDAYYEILIQRGDPIREKKDSIVFGCNNDYISYLPLKPNAPHRGLLWVNHESPEPLFLHGQVNGVKKTKAQVDMELLSVGGSLLEIYKNTKGRWQVDQKSPYNTRVHGMTPIPFSRGALIDGSQQAIGTLGNCAGGQTPWGSFLTCEENYDHFYGEIHYSGHIKKHYDNSFFGWRKYYQHSPEHYGWVVEINPKTKHIQKLVSLGRFAHEGATVTLSKSHRAVVYMGDDKPGECIYKFIADKPNSLESGTLYVANTITGQWIPLQRDAHPILKQTFKTQTELLVRTREAAHLLNGTPQDRPEGIAIDPRTQAVIVSLSNNKSKNNYHGSLLKITEKNDDPLSLHFTSTTLILGGEASGLSCPDNITFDKSGHLWVTNDISDRVLNRDPYKKFKNNGLFVIPTSGPQKNQVLQIASAPNEAELTGPCFLPDGTLLLSVQHPGNGTRDIKNPTSHWPKSKDNLPKSAIVALYLKTQ